MLGVSAMKKKQNLDKGRGVGERGVEARGLLLEEGDFQ